MLLTNTLTLFALVVSDLICIITFILVKKNIKPNQLKTAFLSLALAMIICCTFLVLQILFSRPLNIEPIYFDYIVYIGNCLLPISFFFLGLIFYHSKIKITNKYYLLLLVPVIGLLFLWTNDWHHLFYKNYSIDLSVNEYGIIFEIWDIYTLALFAIGIYYIFRQSLKSSGFFSKQSLLFLLGSLLPLIVNILSITKVIPATIYLTPICFTITLICYALAIFKFKFLSVSPIAIQKIVNRISDSFIVLNENNIITDFNDTFLKTFSLSDNQVRNQNFINFIKKFNLKNLDMNSITETLAKSKTTTETFLFKKDFNITNKYFNIEVNGIFSKNIFLGTLILLKDVTQHTMDMETIENNQNMLMEKERLASLGQMIGGIAHNLKTPIMSIAGATEGLKDLTKEYDISIGDPTVTNEDHHAIVKDMNKWINRIQTYTSYMSDIITAVKGQAVAFSNDSSDSFTVSELITHVNVLMKHELKSALIQLNTSVLVPNTLSIKGNINSLVQVINNMVSNAIQAYNGQTHKNIDFIIKSKNKNIIFTIQDYGCGMSQKVQDKLFKEMITTKGKNGTGLGLFMSYSNIRAHFNGDITFRSEEGKGTRFDITIPLR